MDLRLGLRIIATWAAVTKESKDIQLLRKNASDTELLAKSLLEEHFPREDEPNA